MSWFAALIAILILTAACSGDGKPQSSAPPTQTKTQGAIPTDGSGAARVRDDNRTAICVSGMAGAEKAEAQAKVAIESALVDVSQRWPRAWRIAGYLDQLAPTVEVGCPFPPAHYGEGVDVFGIGRRVDVPAYFRVFVYVLPQSELCNVVGRLVGRRGTEEVQNAGGDVGFETTIGLYLGDEELDDELFMEDQMAIALGMHGPDYGTTSTCPG